MDSLLANGFPLVNWSYRESIFFPGIFTPHHIVGGHSRSRRQFHIKSLFERM
jgi:hypothetical protein